MKIPKLFPKSTLASGWNTIKRNWFVGLVHKFVLALFVLSVAMLIWRWQSLPPQVPLWFSRPWGADQLASPYWLFLLPITGIALYGINVFISAYLMTDYLLFTQMLFLSSLIVNILSFFSLIKILFLIT